MKFNFTFNIVIVFLVISLLLIQMCRPYLPYPNEYESKDNYPSAILIVSTLDGVLHALDLNDEGKEIWKLNIGYDPLISSSLGKAEAIREGVKVRVIPSLDGKLYQYEQKLQDPFASTRLDNQKRYYDGGSDDDDYNPISDETLITALPFTTNSLLEKSLRFSDDIVLVGGEYATTYGIDLENGKLNYKCGLDGCQQNIVSQTTTTTPSLNPLPIDETPFSKFLNRNPTCDTPCRADQTDSNILLVKRLDRVVRSIDTRFGFEKWNFSVGDIDVNYVQYHKQNLHQPLSQRVPALDNPTASSTSTVDRTENGQPTSQQLVNDYDNTYDYDSNDPGSQDYDKFEEPATFENGPALSLYDFGLTIHVPEGVVTGYKPGVASETSDNKDVPVSQDKTEASIIPIYNNTPSTNSQARLLIAKHENVTLASASPKFTRDREWHKSFTCPIAKVWSIIDGRVQLLNLYDGEYVGALKMSQPHHLPRGSPIYIGTYKGQLYVQSPPNSNLQHFDVAGLPARNIPTPKPPPRYPILPRHLDIKEQADESLSETFESINYPLSIPTSTTNVYWKPYLASSLTRTPRKPSFTHPLLHRKYEAYRKRRGSSYIGSDFRKFLTSSESSPTSSDADSTDHAYTINRSVELSKTALEEFVIDKVDANMFELPSPPKSEMDHENLNLSDDLSVKAFRSYMDYPVDSGFYLWPEYRGNNPSKYPSNDQRSDSSNEDDLDDQDQEIEHGEEDGGGTFRDHLQLKGGSIIDRADVCFSLPRYEIFGVPPPDFDPVRGSNYFNPHRAAPLKNRFCYAPQTKYKSIKDTYTRFGDRDNRLPIEWKDGEDSNIANSQKYSSPNKPVKSVDARTRINTKYSIYTLGGGSYGSVWLYWKEIVFVSLCITILIHLFLFSGGLEYILQRYVPQIFWTLVALDTTRMFVVRGSNSSGTGGTTSHLKKTRLSIESKRDSKGEPPVDDLNHPTGRQNSSGYQSRNSTVSNNALSQRPVISRERQSNSESLNDSRESAVFRNRKFSAGKTCSETPVPGVTGGNSNSNQHQHVPTKNLLNFAAKGKLSETNDNASNPEETSLIHRSETQIPLANAQMSRFLNDFQTVHCLGRGGFGLVLQVKNRMDDQYYAIKRIVLPDNENSKEKVLREVKALAKLDHVNIVRYFQAWIERDFRNSISPGCDIKRECRKRNVLQKSPRKNLLKSDTDLSTSLNTDASRLLGESGMFEEVPSSHPFSSYSDPYSYNNNPVDSKTAPQSIKPHESMLVEDSDPVVIFTDETSFSPKYEPKGGHLTAALKDLESEKPPPTTESGDIVQRQKRPSFPTGTSSKNKLFLYIQMQLCQRQTLKEWLLYRSSPPPLPPSLHQSSSPSTHSPPYVHFPWISKETNTPTDSLSGAHHLESSTTDLTDPINPDLARFFTEEKRNALYIFDQIVDAVQYFHEHGLIHRDLKPSNIFFSVEGIVKIGDFGLAVSDDSFIVSSRHANTSPAKSAKNAKPTDGSSSLACVPENFSELNNKQFTLRVGTRLYMSPEQVENKTYTNKIDIYSLGLILFELLVPFSTQMERIKTLTQCRQNHFPAHFETNFPNESKIVKLLLCKDPNDRPTAKLLKLNTDYVALLKTIMHPPS